MLGDLIFAEPKALIGFAGRRVIEQTLQEQLPEDFQTSEYLLHHGLLDLIIPRSFLKQALAETITLYKDAPFRRSGYIPHGFQSSLSLVTQEKIRREFQQMTQNSNQSYNQMLTSFENALNTLSIEKLTNEEIKGLLKDESSNLINTATTNTLDWAYSPKN
jgi:acetyl-CoA carboxylase carboxyl transferase subunit beta